ncbi:hypothetical protein TruAng_001383 [Truncatella angustata]|nr:hypothetical protein TruAng_001383 [Truncatella angustata]
MGRYVPPDLEGTISGNKLNKKHPLGSRASKPGALTVRFEMPYAVWCTTCPKETIIGQGVRFNASKTRVGSYYSTPIFAFRIKHTACGGTIEIRTDPKNTAYIVTEGGRKREDGADQVKDGDWEIMTDAEREKLRGNAFAKLEKTIEDREQLIVAKQRVEELQENNKTWDDPYEMNTRLRKEFRVGRHQREKEGHATEDLKDRMSLGIELLPEKEEDKIRAGLVDFGSILRETGEEAMAAQGLHKPLFENTITAAKTDASNGKKKLKSEVKAEQTKRDLVSELVNNTRISHDPFLHMDKRLSTTKTPVRIPGIKRKRASIDQDTRGDKTTDRITDTVNASIAAEAIGSQQAHTTNAALVAYESDSE